MLLNLKVDDAFVGLILNLFSHSDFSLVSRLTKFTRVMGAVNAGDGGVVLPLADDGHREADEHQQAQEAEDNPEKPKRAKRLK